MYVINLYFQTQVEEGQENLTRRQQVCAINILFRGELLESIEVVSAKPC